MKSTSYKQTGTGDFVITTTIGSEELLNNVMPKIFEAVIDGIASGLTKEYVRDHAQEIFAKINQEAIATMVVAQSGNAIKDMLDKKLPDKVIRETETEIYQRGIFGGITRVR